MAATTGASTSTPSPNSFVYDLVDLTPAKRPRLVPGESEIIQIQDVNYCSCYDSPSASSQDTTSINNIKHNFLLLTSHRICIITRDLIHSKYIHLSNIKHIDKKTSFLSNSKLVIHKNMQQPIPHPQELDQVEFDIATSYYLRKDVSNTTRIRMIESATAATATDQTVGPTCHLEFHDKKNFEIAYNQIQSLIASQIWKSLAKQKLTINQQHYDMVTGDGSCYASNLKPTNQKINNNSQQLTQVNNEKVAASSSSLSEFAFARSAGISGILRDFDVQKTRMNADFEERMSDLNALMKNAQQIVDLINRVNKSNSSQQQSSDIESFNSIVADMGVVGVINKSMMNNDERAYLTALAQQLSDFIDPILSSHGGLLPLTEVYCIYNRSRGTDLISPSDLFRACQLLNKFNFQVKLHQFQSGVYVLRNDDASIQYYHNQIVQLLNTCACFDASQLSQHLKCSFLIADEQIEIAEQAGIIVRDEQNLSMGIVYFVNKYF